MKRRLRFQAAAVLTAVPALALVCSCSPANRDAREDDGALRMAIITPSHDNPFFKAEADPARRACGTLAQP